MDTLTSSSASMKSTPSAEPSRLFNLSSTAPLISTSWSRNLDRTPKLELGWVGMDVFMQAASKKKKEKKGQVCTVLVCVGINFVP